LCNGASQGIWVDVVDEAPVPVDLDHGDPLPVRRLELWIAVDRDFPQLEPELVARRGDDATGCLAEVAARRGVKRDLCYG
jgi:hypothetical protein